MIVREKSNHKPTLVRVRIKFAIFKTDCTTCEILVYFISYIKRNFKVVGHSHLAPTSLGASLNARYGSYQFHNFQRTTLYQMDDGMSTINRRGVTHRHGFESKITQITPGIKKRYQFSTIEIAFECRLVSILAMKSATHIQVKLRTQNTPKCIGH